MNIGLFTPIFNHLPFDQMLAEVARYPQITSLEIGTGGYPGNAHLDLELLLANRTAAKTYRQRLTDANLRISALSCHSNVVHPVAEIAARDTALFHQTLQLANLLEVDTVVTFSGCPGASAHDVTPNWITVAWPPEYQTALTWQWEQRLIPFWREAETLASSQGVRIALETHPGFSVYNTDTLLKLRAATGPALGINLDPSHLWWQGIDIPSAIEALGPAIFHIHAKDVAIHPRNTARNGVVDPKSYRDMAARSWLFRSVGWGHSESDWKAIISALRLAGYDGALSIEHEDALLSTDEGLRSAVDFLARMVPTESPVDPWWA